MSASVKRTQADVDLLSRAADLQQWAVDHAAAGVKTPVETAMVELFRHTAWMGGLDLDLLSRIPCDEVVVLARAVLAEAGVKIDGEGKGSG